MATAVIGHMPFEGHRTVAEWGVKPAVTFTAPPASGYVERAVRGTQSHRAPRSQRKATGICVICPLPNNRTCDWDRCPQLPARNRSLMGA